MDLEEYSQYHGIKQVTDEEKEKQKVERLKARVEEFSAVNTVEAAKELAKKSMPVANEVNRFRVGNARCVIINKEDSFRISIDTDTEFIAYDFLE